MKLFLILMFSLFCLAHLTYAAPTADADPIFKAIGRGREGGFGSVNRKSGWAVLGRGREGGGFPVNYEQPQQLQRRF